MKIALCDLPQPPSHYQEGPASLLVDVPSSLAAPDLRGQAPKY